MKSQIAAIVLLSTLIFGYEINCRPLLGENSVTARYDSPPGYTRYFCASSSGKPLLAGSSGVVLSLGATVEEDTVILLPTISTIVAIENYSDGFLALTEEHQLYRHSSNQTSIVFSKWDVTTSFLGQYHWLYTRQGQVFVGHNKDDKPFYVLTDRGGVSYYGSVNPDSAVIGFNDGSICIVSNSGNLLLDTQVVNAPVSFVALDSRGGMVVSTVEGTISYDPGNQAWSSYLPDEVRSKALIGAGHYVIFDREFLHKDSTFMAFAVYDSGGSNVYKGMFTRYSQDPIDSNRVIHFKYDFPSGKEMLVASASKMYVCSSVPGRYLASTNDGFSGFKFIDPNTNPFVYIQRGFGTAGPDGKCYTVASLRAGSRETLQHLNIVAKSSPVERTTYDTLDAVKYGVPLKASVSAVLSTRTSFTYFFSNIDTTLTIDNSSGNYAITPKVPCSKVWSRGKCHFALLDFIVSVSTDDGLTWRRRVFNLPGKVQDAIFTSDSEFVCLTSDFLIESTLSITSDHGATWSQLKIPGVWGGIAGIRAGKLLLLPVQTGLTDVPLHVSLGAADLASGEVDILVDSIFTSTGRIATGALIGDSVHLIVSGSLGTVTIDLVKAQCHTDSATTFRCPRYQNGGLTSQTGKSIAYSSSSGNLIFLGDPQVTRIDDNLLRVDVNKVWPVPTTSYIRCKVLLFEEDRSAATAKLYDVNGNLQYDLTPELHNGTYTDGFVEFERHDMFLPAGTYFLVVKSGGSISSKNILIMK